MWELIGIFVGSVVVFAWLAWLSYRFMLSVGEPSEQESAEIDDLKDALRDSDGLLHEIDVRQ